MAANKNTFMDYKTQIQHLRNKNLIIEDDDLAIHILSKVGYYGLINGYKKNFKDTATNHYIFAVSIPYTGLCTLIRSHTPASPPVTSTRRSQHVHHCPNQITYLFVSYLAFAPTFLWNSDNLLLHH